MSTGPRNSPLSQNLVGTVAPFTLPFAGPLEELVHAPGFRGHEECRPEQRPVAGGLVVLRRQDRHVALPLHHPRRGLVRRAPPHHRRHPLGEVRKKASVWGRIGANGGFFTAQLCCATCDQLHVPYRRRRAYHVPGT